MFGRKALVKNITDELNIIVQRRLDDVYSTCDQKLDELIKLHRENRDKFAIIEGFLYALVGTNTPPRNPGEQVSEEVRRYAAKIHSDIGSVVEGLPEPPASLTGRRRGSS